MKSVAGKVAFITGGASGIGLGIAGAFVDAGMKVVLADVERTALDRAVAELRSGGDVTGIVTDVSRLESVQALARQTLHRDVR